LKDNDYPQFGLADFFEKPMLYSQAHDTVVGTQPGHSPGFVSPQIQ
jgi:hypothetical protein